ncbi:MAG: leucine-rich repeat protein [Lachnospiraceae bacterium]|nr:leucine-rich repeat protein [Lachnospiraceae bacterium]
MKKPVVALAVILAISTQSVMAASLTSITGSSFPNVHITSLNIGTSVTEISDDAFTNLHELRKITVSKSNPDYTSYDGCLYDKDKTVLICFPQSLNGASIPDTVTDIAPSALEGRSASFRSKIRDAVAKNAGKTAAKENKDAASGSERAGSGSKTDDKDPADNIISVPAATISCDDTPLGNAVRSILESLNVTGMSKEAALRACYDHMMKTYSYRRFTDVYSNGWTKHYATDLFASKTSNCSSYAAGLAYLAKGIGYDARVATGTIDSAGNLPAPHAWCEIRLDDGWYIFDAEMDQAKANKEYYKKTYENYPSTGLTKQLEWSCEF